MLCRECAESSADPASCGASCCLAGPVGPLAHCARRTRDCVLGSPVASCDSGCGAGLLRHAGFSGAMLSCPSLLTTLWYCLHKGGRQPLLRAAASCSAPHLHLLTGLAVCVQRGSDGEARLTDARRPSAYVARHGNAVQAANPRAVRPRSRRALLARRVRAARRSVAVRAETADVEGTKLDLGDAESTGGQAQYAGVLGGALSSLPWWAGCAGVAQNWLQLSVLSSYLRTLPLTRTLLSVGATIHLLHCL